MATRHRYRLEYWKAFSQAGRVEGNVYRLDDWYDAVRYWGGTAGEWCQPGGGCVLYDRGERELLCCLIGQDGEARLRGAWMRPGMERMGPREAALTLLADPPDLTPRHHCGGPEPEAPDPLAGERQRAIETLCRLGMGRGEAERRIGQVAGTTAEAMIQAVYRQETFIAGVPSP